MAAPRPGIKVDFAAAAQHPLGPQDMARQAKDPRTMLLAIPFPDISPEIFAISVGDFRFALRWYALAYIVGLLAGWWIIVRAMRAPELWPANTPPMRPRRWRGS
jgi:hypothetical protein